MLAKERLTEDRLTKAIVQNLIAEALSPDKLYDNFQVIAMSRDPETGIMKIRTRDGDEFTVTISENPF